jgi:branched-chain amino acid transport system permease protein
MHVLKPHRVAFWLALVTLWGAALSPALAIDYTWTGLAWNDDWFGTRFDGATWWTNWVPFGFPQTSSDNALISAAGALVVGWFCVRLSHIYFAMLTLAFGQIVFTVTLQWYSFSGGDNGITEIPLPTFLQSTLRYYYFALAVLMLCLWGMKRIVDSPFGKALQALRDNPLRTASIGINVRLYSWMAFMIAGAFAGIGGALFAAFNHNVFPTFMHWTKSTEALVVTLLGGMFHFYGPAVGSVILIFLDKLVTNYLRYWSFVLGLLLALMVLFFRGGFTGFLAERLEIYRASKDGDHDP